MKFGINWICSWDKAHTQTQVYDDFVKVAVAAEELGYWSVSTTEHHMKNDPRSRPYGFEEFPWAYDICTDTLSLLGYVAARTSRIRVKSALVVAQYDHPARIAERAAMIDNLSHGRLEFGIGQGGSQGWREPIIYQIPADPAAKQRKFIEILDIIVKIWSGEEFEHDGEFFTLPPGQYVPTPEYNLNSRSMVGSGTPETLRWAAQHGWGYSFAGLAQGYGSLENAIEVERVFREAAFEVGRDPSALLSAQHLLCYCGESDDEAAETFGHYLTEGSKVGSPHGLKTRLTAPQVTTDTSETLRQRVQKTIDEQIIGSPETCIERIKFFQSKSQDLSYITLSVGRGGIPAEIAIKSLERFAKDVFPAFSDVEIPTEAR